MDSANNIKQNIPSMEYEKDPKNMSVLKKHNMTASLEEDPNCCFRFTKFIKLRCNAIIKPTCLIYLCISIYTIICLLGNVVTSIIYIKHPQTSKETNIVDNFTTTSDSVLNLNLNESAILASNFEFDSKNSDSQDMSLNMVFYNESDNEVSYNFIIYHVISQASVLRVLSRIGVINFP